MWGEIQLFSYTRITNFSADIYIYIYMCVCVCVCVCVHTLIGILEIYYVIKLQKFCVFSVTVHSEHKR